MPRAMSFNDATVALTKEIIIEFIFGIWIKMTPYIVAEKSGTLQNIEGCYHI